MMRLFRAIVLIGAPAVFLSGYATATTRVVPTQFPTIQAAIWASAGNDTVAVLPGTYLENIEIDRGVVIRSTGGPAVTVIDGSNASDPDSASTVTMRTGTITGFDIRNGSGALDPGFSHRYGGGVLATGGVVRANWIHNNVLTGVGGSGAGIRAEGTVSVLQNRIYNNRVEVGTSGSGGGVSGQGVGVLFQRNEIFGNHVENGGVGGAIGWATFRDNIVACNTVDVSLTPNASGLRVVQFTAEGNTIVGNWSSSDGPALSIWAIDCTPPCPVPVFGNCIAYNIGEGARCVLDEPSSAVDFACNNFFGNTGVPVAGECGNVIGQNGNIAVDPEFGAGTCPYETGHWCLGPDSPLLPENSPPGCGLIGAVGECSQIGIADSPPPAGSLRGGPAAPNPFTERTTIPFYLAKESAVEIAIVDVLGRQIRRIEPGHMTVGDHAAEWDGRTGEGVRAASGAYIAVIRAGGVEVTQTLLLLR